MKTFAVTIVDALRFKSIIHVEGVNASTLELGLNATLGMVGCEILHIEEYTPAEY